jgi:PhnB protein
MQVTPYLMLDGRGDEAIEFYKKALGAKVDMLMRFSEAPKEANCTPSSMDKVMHAALSVGDSKIMLSDGNNAGKPTFAGVSLTITAKDEAEADKLFGAISEGGQIQMPMEKTFFAKRFGMAADKFGVNWMIIAE